MTARVLVPQSTEAVTQSVADAPVLPRLVRRIVVVDDHGLLAQSLVFTLRGHGFPAEVCAELTSQGILDSVTHPRAGLMLLDLDLGGEMGTSLPLIPRLCERGTRVLMLTGVTDRLRLAECVRAGAIGIVSKQRPFGEVVGLVRRAIEQGTTFAPGERDGYLADLRRLRGEQDARLAHFSRLTPSERSVLQGIVDGCSAAEISVAAHVSMGTVRSHIHSLLQKLGVNSQIAAVALARRAGWEPSER